MSVERHQGGASLIDVLDRVLDRGIVIDAGIRVSAVGIDLSPVEARVIVASIDTYLKYSEAIGQPVTPVPSHADPLPDDDDDGGGPGPTGGAPSFAGVARTLPRIPPPRHRRPID